MALQEVDPKYVVGPLNTDENVKFHVKWPFNVYNIELITFVQLFQPSG